MTQNNSPIQYSEKTLHENKIDPESCFQIKMHDQDDENTSWIEDKGQSIQEVFDSIMKMIHETFDHHDPDKNHQLSIHFQVQSPKKQFVSTEIAEGTETLEGREIKNGMAISSPPYFGNDMAIVLIPPK